MTVRLRMAATLAAVITVAGALPAAADTTNWKAVTGPPVDGAFTAVTVEGDLPHPWLFGQSSRGASLAFQLTDAQSWRQVEVPDVGRVESAFVEWAVGERGLLHLEAGQWRRVEFASTPGTRTALKSVAVAGDPLTPVAVGTEHAGRVTRGVAQRWDGSRWVRMPVPRDLLDDSSALTVVGAFGVGVAAFGVDYTAQGATALALYWDGKAWTRLRAQPRSGWEESLAATNDGYVVGWTAPRGARPAERRPLVYTVDVENGRLVRQQVPDDRAELTAIANQYGSALPVGHTADGRPYGLTEQGDGEPFLREPMPAGRGVRLLSASGFITPDIWAVGFSQDRYGRMRPLALRYVM